MPTSTTRRPRGRLSLFPATVFIILGAVLLAHATAAAASAPPGSGNDKHLKVRRITPSGSDAPPGRQLLFEFDRPMAPLGDMNRRDDQIPVRIEPPLSCHWRWLNQQSLACNLDEKNALQPATSYLLTLSPGLTALDGATLAKPITHKFATVRPRIGEVWFKNWLSPSRPQSVVRTSLPVRRESLVAHLFYQAGGRRIGAEVQPDPDYGTADAKVWLVNPGEDLPATSPVRLQIEPGLQAQQGSLTGGESRTVATLQTIPEPRLLGLRCQNKHQKTFTLSVGQPLGEQRCLPSAGVTLLFSAPVLAENLRHGLQLDPDLLPVEKGGNPWEQVPSYSQLTEPYDKTKRYGIDLPESVLKPNTTYRLRLAPGAVRDEFGRPLREGADVSFATDHRNPDFALLKNLPVLEKDLDSDIHLWAVNLRELRLTYDRIGAAGDKEAATATVKPQGAPDTSIAVPLTLRSLLGKSSGVVQGNFASLPPVPDKGPDDNWFFAQITPFQVHLKLGHHNSLAWITDLKSGQAVAEVNVEVIKSNFRNFGNPTTPLASAATDGDGVAHLPGTKVLDPKLTHVYTSDREEESLFLLCRKGEDMAVLPVRYDYQVAAEGANRQYIPEWLRPRYGHLKVWGATAQGIYKAGDTVQYKIFVRNQDNLRLTPPPGAGGALPEGEVQTAPPTYSLKVFDPLGKLVHEETKIAISPFGAFHGEVALAAGGAVGWHRFVVGASFSAEEWEAMRVLVSDFTPAPFKVKTDLSSERFHLGDQVWVDTSAKLHAGGPYGDASVNLTATLEASELTTDNPRLQGFQFDSRIASEEEAREVEMINEHQSRLDNQGQLQHTFTITETPILLGRLTVESAVQDDRGKTIAQRGTAAYFGRDRYIGLLQEDWTLAEGKASAVRVAVVDERGQMVAGLPFSLKSEEKVTYGARVKGAGDGYHHQYEHRWQTVEEQSGVSGSEPLELRVTPKRAGHFRLTATITDSLGRNHSTSIERWVTGSGQVLWEAAPGNLLSVYPEKNTYAVGDTARFLVQNPFPGAQALITVERLGVIERWSKALTGNSEIIEFPVRPDHLPGFYLSVLVTSPRVEQPPGPEGEDLGKPTYRLGYVKVPVRDPYKELTVAITPQRDSYKPGETAEIELAVAPRRPFDGPTPPVELAVAVIDEAVFDLLKDGRKRYDPYANFYGLEELDLSNYNLLMQLVGREYLARKGADAAGDGGDFSLRSLFKYVAYWNPALSPDDNGRATIRVPLPDNLTAWKVLAMAVTPSDRMGLGEATFKVNQQTEIRPILPNRLLAGDSFSAGYTLVNRTDLTRTLTVRFQAEGPLQPTAEAAANSSREVALAPFQRQVLRFPLLTNGAGELRLFLSAGDELDRDGLESRVAVAENLRPRTAAVFGTVEGEKANQAIAFPESIGAGQGNLQVSLSPTALGNLAGAFAYLKDYPYGCWEQKLSRGMMAALLPPLAPYLQGDFAWPESEEAVRQTMSEAQTFQAPSGGMVYFQAQEQWVSPYLSVFTALSFNHLRLLGYQPPRLVEEKLHGYLEQLLRQDNLPQDFSPSMTATVRAAALAALAERGRIGLSEVERFHGQFKAMSLFGQGFYLRALMATGASPEKSREVLDNLLAHADQNAGTVVFNESLAPTYAALHSSTVRDNAAILVTLLAWLDSHRDDLSIRELTTRLVRGLTMARRGKSHWASTQENLFVSQALAEYARRFEEGELRLEAAVTLDRETLGSGRFTEFKQPPLLLSKPIGPSDAGRNATLELSRSGAGRLYYAAQLSYLPAAEKVQAVNAGIEVFREYSVKRNNGWQLVDKDTPLATGEVVRVDLYVSLPAERYFVVVDDPVPGGLEPVDRELATATQAEEDDTPATGSLRLQSPFWGKNAASRHGFYHRELRHQAARFFSERLAAGRYHLQYSAQAIAPGEFQVPPLHAEEMYNPDVYGDSLTARVVIKAAE